MNPIIEANRPRPAPRPPPVKAIGREPVLNAYPAHTTLTERQLRALVEAESSKALELARAAGVETPPCR